MFLPFSTPQPLAREAFSASKEAMSISNDAKILGVHVDDSFSVRGLASVPEHRTVRSTSLLERQTKRRRVPKPKVELQETTHHRKPGSHRKLDGGYDPNDPLRLFLGGPETTELLNATEEAELIMKIQFVGRRKLRALYCACIAFVGTNDLIFEVYKMVLVFMNKKEK